MPVSLALALLLAALVVRPTPLPLARGEGRARACAPISPPLTLREGFCATVFADHVGIARHLVVAANGDVIVNLLGRSSATRVPTLAPMHAQPGLVVLRDTNGDGRADQSWRHATAGGTGIGWRDGWVYYATATTIERVRWDTTTGVFSPADTVVQALPAEPGHTSKSLALDDRGALHVSIGSATNACRPTGARDGLDPCAELRVRSGIWTYRADRVGQRHPTDGVRTATGVRNAVALTWSRTANGLYALSHGRDNLHVVAPQHFTAAANAERPSEEFVRVTAGDDYGWPYCYHDPVLGRKVLAPEYGGDGVHIGRCASATAPLFAFPAHWGPNGVLIHSGTGMPPQFAGTALIAFHGSWNRMPFAEAGYRVMALPLRDGRPAGQPFVFADGFAGDTLEPLLARHRPVGLAEGPDGAIYLSDDQEGRIWRITWQPGAAPPPASSAAASAAVSAAGSAASRGQVDRDSGWRADLDTLVAAAQRLHASPRRPAHTPAFTAAANALAARVPQLSNERLAVEMQRLLAMLGDGHSLLYPAPSARVAFRMLPIDVYQFSDGVHVVAGAGAGGPLIGSRIEAMGGVPVATLLSRMAPYVSRDNAMGLRAFASLYLVMPSFLEAWGASVAGDSMALQLRALDGRTRTVRLPLGPARRTLRAPPPPPTAAGPAAPTRWLTPSSAPYTVSVDRTARTVLLTFRQVADDPAMPIARLSQALHDSLRISTARDLVIDLRLNTGGNNQLLAPLLATIADFSRTPGARVYALTSRTTFSAAQNFLTRLERQVPSLRVAGEPSMSSPNFTGEDHPVRLPFSGLTVSISTRYWQDSDPTDVRPWIAPHLPVPLSFRDWWSNRDRVWEAVVQDQRRRGR